MNEKNNIKLILDFINEFGADQDDMLEKLESELAQLNLLKAVSNGISSEYEKSLENLEYDLLNEKISIKEYKFGKNIADSIGLKNYNLKLDLEIKIKNLEGRIESYKEIINSLKLKYDSNNERLKKINNFEMQEIDGLKGTNIKLLQRPVGIHPGNPIAARKNKNDAVLEKEQDLKEEENYNNENLNNVLDQLNSLLDESSDKLKIVNKDANGDESKEIKKRGRKINKN